MTQNYLKFLFIFFLALSFITPFYAQVEDDIELENALDKTVEKEDKIKTGWNFGGLPVISYDSDLGFQLGALVNAYDYGDGSRYPAYNHSLYLEGSWFLKGSGIFRFNYDSDRLIKGIRTSVDVSYLPDRLFKFFGFNGYEAVYNEAWEDDENAAQVYGRFYCLTRKQSNGLVADLMLCLSNRVFRSNKFCLPITRNDLADLTGLSIESVMRIMKEFKEDGLIDTKGKNIEILSQESLEKISMFG